jgi:hypothetical protein
MIENVNNFPFLAGFGVGFIGWFIILMIWSLVWKGLALWRSAKRDHTAWFIIFLLIHTAGILEIIYLLITREPKKPTEISTPNSTQTL